MNRNSQTYQQAWPFPFMLIWTGQSLAMITSETVQFALIWWLTQTTGSATFVSLATMTALLPRALLGAFMGALADRWDRRKILILSHAGVIFSLILLGLLFYLDKISTWNIIVIIFAVACCKSFQMPAMMILTTFMVPKSALSQIAGLNQVVQGAMRIAAPAFGAVLVKTLTMNMIVLVDVGGALLALTVLLPYNIKSTRPVEIFSTQIMLKSTWGDFKEGIQYLKNWMGASQMLVISTSVNFLSCPAFMLTSILVTKHFSGSVQQFSVISAAVGIGIICGGIFLSLWKGFARPMETSICGIIVMSLALLLVGITPSSSFWLAACGMFLGGFSIPICMAPIQVLIQKTVAATIQGRILTLLDSTSTAASPLSLILAGPIFDHLGPQFWYISSSILILTIGLLGRIDSRVMELGTIPEIPGDAGSISESKS